MAILGLDLLGLLGYSKKTTQKISKKLPKGSIIGVIIDTTFSGDLTNLHTMLQGGNVAACALDFFNTTAVRNNKLQKEELLYGYTINSLENDAKNMAPKLLKLIDRQCTLFKTIADAYPGIKFYPCLFLEHDLTRSSVEKLIRYAQGKLPGFQFIDNPLKAYSKISGTLMEQHGNEPGKYDSVSNDGSSFWDCEPEKYKACGIEIVMGWIHEFNKNATGIKEFIMPRKRKIDIEEHQINHIIKVLYNAPEPRPTSHPKGFEKARDLKERELLKVMAEDYKDGKDGRGSRPMFISKSRAQKLEVFNRQGKKIAHFGYYGDYSGDKGYFRHYLGKFSPRPGQTSGSGETAMQIVKKAGSEWVYIKSENAIWLVNILRRAGYYRK